MDISAIIAIIAFTINMIFIHHRIKTLNGGLVMLSLGVIVQGAIGAAVSLNIYAASIYLALTIAGAYSFFQVTKEISEYAKQFETLDFKKQLEQLIKDMEDDEDDEYDEDEDRRNQESHFCPKCDSGQSMVVMRHPTDIDHDVLECQLCGHQWERWIKRYATDHGDQDAPVTK